MIGLRLEAKKWICCPEVNGQFLTRKRRILFKTVENPCQIGRLPTHKKTAFRSLASSSEFAAEGTGNVSNVCLTEDLSLITVNSN
jgi:hypothetical protein